ncbi:hypothetical protein F511_36776 [Dorcoceras hygrometricum]|uniref:Uncharacterized protein n=1 Tax=Dorcoceras hygrometricum TaxID=472368 RepID=A0A2Z7BKB8_9LAMI|nr:hypothetical protein F511_36776 [Dorcoceras hygrometricum]
MPSTDNRKACVINATHNRDAYVSHLIAKISNSTTTSWSFNSSIQVYKLVSIESPKEDELSATNLAPYGDVNRCQSTEKGCK